MILEDLINNNYLAAKEKILCRMNELLEKKLVSLKKIIGENLFEEETDECLEEANVQKMGRLKLVRVRIRGGKVQRRVKKSGVKGYTLRGGKLKRITVAQRMKMKRVQKRAAIKRRAKMARSIMKRKRSMRRLRSLGVR